MFITMMIVSKQAKILEQRFIVMLIFLSVRGYAGRVRLNGNGFT